MRAITVYCARVCHGYFVGCFPMGILAWNESHAERYPTMTCNASEHHGSSLPVFMQYPFRTLIFFINNGRRLLTYAH